MSNQEELLQKISTNLEKIENIRPLSKGELAELQKSLGVLFTYSSNAIEGNTLTLGETKLILEDGITIGGKTLREVYEAANHKGVFKILYSCIDGKKELTEEIILTIHKGVLKNIDDDNAGKYRNIQCYISGEEELPPKASQVGERMKELLEWYRENKTVLHPAVLAGEFHYRFVKIHPFIDGNGRTVRVLINLILMSYGYPMTIISPVRRREYIAALNSASKKEVFMIFMLDTINVNLEDYLRMIEV